MLEANGTRWSDSHYGQCDVAQWCRIKTDKSVLRRVTKTSFFWEREKDSMAQSQGHRHPPNCSLGADHSHGGRSMFFISCSMAGKTALWECTHAAHSLPKIVFRKEEKNTIFMSFFWTPEGGPQDCEGREKAIKNWSHPKTIKKCFSNLAFGTVGRVL